MILYLNDNNWEGLLFIVFFVYLFFAASIDLFFIPSPADLGLSLKEEISEDFARETILARNSARSELILETSNTNDYDQYERV